MGSNDVTIHGYPSVSDRDDPGEVYRPIINPPRWCSKCVAWCDHTSRSHTDEGETSR